MGGKKSKAPAAPDYSAIAQQTGQENKEIAQMLTNANRPNQSDVYGNTIGWTQGPNGAWSQNTSWSPNNQARMNEWLNMGDYMRGQASSLMDYNWRNSFSNIPIFGQAQYSQAPSNSMLQGIGAAGSQNPGSYGVRGVDPGYYNTGVNMQNYGVRGVGQGEANTGVNLGQWGANSIGQGATNTGVNLGNWGASPLTSGQANTGVNLGNYGVNQIGPNTDTSVNMKNYGLTGIGSNVPGEVPQYDPNAGKSVADALYGSVMDRGRVEQQRETDALTTQLRQQGLQPGTAAFDRAMTNLRTSQNDANLLAAQNATLAGGQEARDIYGARLAGNQQRFGQMQGQQATNLQNAQFQQGMNQQDYQNELSRQQANLGMAAAQQGMNQQNYQNLANNQAQNAALANQQFGMNQAGFENQLARQQGNMGLAGMQNQMQQQNYQNALAGIESNRANAQFGNQMNQQNLANRLGIDTNNRANWQFGEQQIQNQFQRQQGAAENQRANYEAMLKAQAQNYGQALSNRNQQFQDMSNYLGMASAIPGSIPSTQFQGFGTATGYSPADMMGAANAQYAAKMGGYNAGQNKKGGLLSAGTQLGSSFLGGK